MFSFSQFSIPHLDTAGLMILLKPKPDYVSPVIKTLQWVYILRRFEMKLLAILTWSARPNTIWGRQSVSSPDHRTLGLPILSHSPPATLVSWLSPLGTPAQSLHTCSSLCLACPTSIIPKVKSLDFFRLLLQCHLQKEPFPGHAISKLHFQVSITYFSALRLYHFPAYCIVHFLFFSLRVQETMNPWGRNFCLSCIRLPPKGLHRVWYLMYNNKNAHGK